MSKLLTVFGATGNQGGSVIKAVLAHPKLASVYRIRAVTRDTSKPAAQALASQGVEVVQGDINSEQDLKKIIGGSETVYAVTNYWESRSKELEMTQGKRIADVCVSEGVSHLIWSSLPHVTKMTNGRLKHVEHFDSKAEVEDYIRSKNMPASFFMPGFFMSNLKNSLRPTGDGSAYSFTSVFHPDTNLPMLDVREDTGKFVAAALVHGPSPKRILGVSNWSSPIDIDQAMQETHSKPVEYTEVDVETFMKFLPPATAQEVAENFLLIRDYGYYGPGAEEESKSSMAMVDPSQPLTSLKEFFKTNF